MAMSNAERQKAYRERKKAMQSRKSVMELMEGQDRYRKELQPGPVFVRKVPTPCVVEDNPDDLPPVKIVETEMIVCPAEAVEGLEQYYAEAKIPEGPLTDFDVYKRRHDGMFK